MRPSLLLLGSLALAACGGKGVVDGHHDLGAGGAATSSSSDAASVAASSSTGDGCPEFPLLQAACTIPGQVCPVPFACCNGLAICGQKNVWEFSSPACAQPCIPCLGGLSCSASGICVDYQFDSQEVFSCRQDPCPGSTDCACAQPVCDTAGLTCQSHAAELLVCDCPTC